MKDAAYYRQKAAHCLRLADQILNEQDPVVAALKSLAREFIAKAEEKEHERTASN